MMGCKSARQAAVERSLPPRTFDILLTLEVDGFAAQDVMLILPGEEQPVRAIKINEQQYRLKGETDAPLPAAAFLVMPPMQSPMYIGVENQRMEVRLSYATLSSSAKGSLTLKSGRVYNLHHKGSFDDANLNRIQELLPYGPDKPIIARLHKRLTRLATLHPDHPSTGYYVAEYLQVMGQCIDYDKFSSLYDLLQLDAYPQPISVQIEAGRQRLYYSQGNRPMPEFQLQDASGNVYRRSDLDDSLTLYTFWEPGNPYNAERNAQNMAFYESYADKRYTLVFVTTDSTDLWQQELEVTSGERVYRLRDVDGVLSRELGINGVGNVVVDDRSRIIAFDATTDLLAELASKYLD